MSKDEENLRDLRNETVVEFAIYVIVALALFAAVLL